jgi:hypothetical protein
MEKSHKEMVTAKERENLLFIDQGYENEERIVKLAKKMSGEW